MIQEFTTSSVISVLKFLCETHTNSVTPNACSFGRLFQGVVLL